MMDDKVEVIVTSADVIAVLTMMDQNAINIQNVEFMDPLQIRFVLASRDLSVLKEIVRKRGETLKVVNQKGLAFLLKKLLYRPVFCVGIFMVLMLSCWLPTRILFVKVVGNETVSQRLILEQAQKFGIGFLSSRREVRSEKIKNALLAQVPQLEWAGITTYGCTAFITVQERKSESTQPCVPQISHIVSLSDAIIGEMTVEQGNALCKPGQAVKSGQILVSGYTDCGICIKATRAKAEIWGETIRNLTVVFPTEFAVRQENTSSVQKYSLILGKKRINFFKGSGISGTTCAKIYKEKYLTLPGGFVLPIAIARETVIACTSQVESLEFVNQALSEFAHHYVTDQMPSGSILSANEVFVTMNGCCRLDGFYRCYEMIGITRVEERIVRNE